MISEKSEVCGDPDKKEKKKKNVSVVIKLLLLTMYIIGIDVFPTIFNKMSDFVFAFIVKLPLCRV